MLDFTSAHYLGLRHDPASIGAWSRLSAGVPAALAEPDGAPALCDAMAAWLGVQRVTLLPSTLHLFWDLFGAMMDGDEAIFWDDGAYPIARWGVERARGRRVPATPFRHHDPDSLRRAMLRLRSARRPVVVTDGFCPGCARHAPLTAYRDLARDAGGWVVVDDTQAIGLYGPPARGAPYGLQGRGTLAHLRLDGDAVLVGASLSKALGVPIAALAGPRAWIERFERRSDTRVHCSPATTTVIAAGAHALSVNARRGELLRRRLADNVRRFSSGLRAFGHASVGGLHPIQRVLSVSPGDAPSVYTRLLRCGVRAVLQRPACSGVASVTFVLSANHAPDDIERAVSTLTALTARDVSGASIEPPDRSLKP